MYTFEPRDHNTLTNFIIRRLIFFSLVASSNIGPVCLPNAGLNIGDYQSSWTTQFSHVENGGEEIMIAHANCK